MVERDEDSRSGKRMNGSDRKQESPPAFVNQFARYIESKVSYAEILQLGHPNQVSLRRNSAPGDSGTNTAVPSKLDGNLSRSESTASFDSSAPSTPSLPRSISSPDLESQHNDNCLPGHDIPNSSSSATTKPSSNPSETINPLYFGKLKSCLTLPKSFPYQYSSTCTNLKSSINGKPPTSSTSSRISNSVILRGELQRLVKLAMESGKLQRQCANCGNSKHCCGRTLLEAVSSITGPQ